MHIRSFLPAAVGLFVGLLLAGPAQAVSCDELDYVKSTTADLDGDGVPERIALQDLDGEGGFTLVIGNARISGQLDSEVEGLAVVDIDRGDRFKEVVVYTPGPSADDNSNFYSYDGQGIREMANSLKWFDIQGNGIVRDSEWMDFWSSNAKYVLDADKRTLRYVPQDLYYVGQEARVTAEFSLFVSRTDHRQMAMPRIGSTITLLAFGAPNPSDKPYRDAANGWYLIKTETGLLGWARFDDFVSNVDGLHFAD